MRRIGGGFLDSAAACRADVTIHSDDPFVTPEHARSPLRRMRGRLVSPVALWTASVADSRVGLTVTSTLLADGDPGHALGLVDAESELWDRAETTGHVAVSMLGAAHRHLADVFGGLAPAPGGPFRLAQWRQTAWGPVLADTSAWCGGRVVSAREVGYALLVDVALEHIELGAEQAPMGHYRGRYRELDLRG